MQDVSRRAKRRARVHSVRFMAAQRAERAKAARAAHDEEVQNERARNQHLERVVYRNPFTARGVDCTDNPDLLAKLRLCERVARTFAFTPPSNVKHLIHPDCSYRYPDWVSYSDSEANVDAFLSTYQRKADEIREQDAEYRERQRAFISETQGASSCIPVTPDHKGKAFHKRGEQ